MLPTRVISVLVLYRSVPNVTAVWVFLRITRRYLIFRTGWYGTLLPMVLVWLVGINIYLYVRPFVLGLDGGGGGGAGGGASILQRRCVRPVRFSSYFDPSSWSCLTMLMLMLMLTLTLILSYDVDLYVWATVDHWCWWWSWSLILISILILISGLDLDLDLVDIDLGDLNAIDFDGVGFRDFDALCWSFDDVDP